MIATGVNEQARGSVLLDIPTHRYIHVETGRVIQSVSSILRKSHVREPPFTGAGTGQGGPRAAAMQHALQRGRDVHRLTRAMDETYDLTDALDDLFDPADLSPANIDYVSAYDRFLHQSEYRPIAWEVVVWHEALDYAGRADGVGWLGTKRIMIDRKTERTLHRAVWLQLTGYRLAWDWLHPTERIDQTYALVLKANQTYDLKPNPLEQSAEPFWIAAIWLARWHDMVL
ncbi:MAG: hypothetical protein IMZ71_01555 [Chloroflexi bacterium]|nr:hypothetical protein [Chloroflexota bacterium]